MFPLEFAIFSCVGAMEGKANEDGELEEVISIDSSVENKNTVVPISQTSSVAKAVADIQASLSK